MQTASKTVGRVRQRKPAKILTDEQIQAVRLAWGAGRSQATLAAEYEVPDTQISRIVNGRTRGLSPVSSPPPDETREVVGWPGYRVSSDGRVFSCRTHGGRATGGRWVQLPARPNRQGYPQVRLSAGGMTSTVRVHPLVLAAFVGPRPAGHFGCHANGDRSDNRLANLRWDTPAANSADRRRHGTTALGERNGQAKLTTEQVQEVIRLRSAGWAITRIASHVGVSGRQIGRILRGKCWSHAIAADPDVPISRAELVPAGVRPDQMPSRAKGAK